jgi:protein-S-isoprenylcysteine O-methyltransferase Ste14
MLVSSKIKTKYWRLKMLIELLFLVLFVFSHFLFSFVKKRLDKKSELLNPGRTIKARDKHLQKATVLLVRFYYVVACLYILLTVSGFIWKINLGFLWIGLPHWIRILGFLVAMASTAYLFEIYKHLGGNWASTGELANNHRLITSGPYQWIRHPIYTTAQAWDLGLVLISNFWLLVPLLIVSQVILCKRTRLEEKILTEKYNGEYSEYKKQTGMFFPKIIKKHRSFIF